MKKIEQFVTIIQDNRILNAIKSAIIKMAYINIGLAVFIFIFAFTKMETSKTILDLYTLYCLSIGFLMSYFVSMELSSKKQVHYGVVIAVLIGFMFPVLYSEGFESTFPLISLFLTALFYGFFTSIDKLKLKGHTIPQAVFDYYEKTVPVIIVSALALLITLKFPSIILYMAKIILLITTAFSNLWMILLVVILICLFWILGIHGVGVIGTLIRPFWFHMMIINGALILNNHPAIYIGSEAFLQWTVWIGGSGCTIGLSFLLRYFSKSSHLRNMGKESLISNIHNINENIIFGVPVVSNKIFTIPFILAPVSNAIIAYIAFSKNWVTIPSIVSPWVLPAPIGIFISTLGDYRSIILSLVLIMVSVLIYYPFFRKYDRLLVIEEQK